MTALILRADAAALPLAYGTVDLIVTSPPYFNLRSYEDNGSHYAGQVGDEPTPSEYIAHLVDCTREWLRVLKPTGSLFVNLGDCYSAYNNNRGAGGTMSSRPDERRGTQGRGLIPGAPRAKSLFGLPWRYALRCIDELDLILRQEIIWSKPNGMPESVSDRVRRSHEQWFHFVQQPRYFAAVDEIRNPHKRNWAGQNGDTHDRADHYNVGLANGTAQPHPLGALPGSVWEVATAPLQVPASLGVDHYAAFPMAWPRRIISGWSPSGICTACGTGRRPVAPIVSVERAEPRAHRHLPGYTDPAGVGHRGPLRVIDSYACACPDTSAPTRPAVVLDPFGGTGTTALVADVLGRTGISIDRSADYCRVAQWRTTDRNERARAAEEPRPEPIAAGQIGLFE